MQYYELVVRDVASLSIRTIASEERWTPGDRFLSGSALLVIDEVMDIDEFGVVRVVCSRLDGSDPVSSIVPRRSA